MTGEFSRLLRELRTARGLSQWRLARAIGVDHSTVSRFERGQRRPRRLTVLKLARALELDRSTTLMLLASAGYVPVSFELDAGLDVLWELASLLTDARLSRASRERALERLRETALALRAELDRATVRREETSDPEEAVST
jgi:transcriptional regulator with XRE-family HTH domain